MAGSDFGGDADERLRQVFEFGAVQMLLHARGQLHAAEQATSAEVDIKQAKKPAPGEAAGKFLELVKFPGKIAAADQRAD